MVKRIVNLVAWVGVAVIFAALAIRFFKPEWNQYARWGALAGLVCVLLYTLSQWRDVAQLFARRQARLGALSVVNILIVFGILAGINYLAFRQNKRWDLTTAKQFSLSDQTRLVLEKLDAPIQIKVFEREDQSRRFVDRLSEYAYVSKRVAVEYIDPDKKPVQAKQYQVQSYGTVVFEYKGRTERVMSDTEQELTTGLIKVITGQQKKIYFVQGHGERDTVSTERDGYSAIAAALGGENYTVEKLPLAQQPDVPADGSIVVVAGPKVDVLPSEGDALRRYLQKAGKLLVLIDPPDKADRPLPNLTALLNEWAIDVGDNVVVDVSGMGRLIGTDASVPVVVNYPSHPIAEKFTLMTAYPLARSVGPISGGAGGRFAQSFIETSPRSWAETDIQKLTTSGQVLLEETKGDKKGPISLGAAVLASAQEPPAVTPAADTGGDKPDTPKPETRLAAVGDSDFAANYVLGVQGNRDLFLNVIGWLAQQENLIAIRPREPDDRRITLTGSQQSLILWFSILVVPGLIVGSGVYTWWRRR